jgi:hypothetical protein
MVLFADPDLRIWVPSDTYSDKNHWGLEDFAPVLFDDMLVLDGHMPFGVSEYPHEKHPTFWLQVVLIGSLVGIVLVVTVVVLYRKRTRS